MISATQSSARTARIGGSDTTAEAGVQPASPGTGVTSRVARDLRLPVLLLCGLLAVQLVLLFTKSFNWDEFLHFSQVHQALAGTLARPFQVLHARLLFWTPLASSDLIVQMQLARLFMWGAHLVALLAIFGLARIFVGSRDAIWAPLAYLGAGYVFTQGFAIRADPMASATLMTALYLFAARTPSLGRMLAVGALMGLAGMMTLKAVFYAPCFAGIAWWHFNRQGRSKSVVLQIAAALPAALATFLTIYLLHTANLAPIPPQLEPKSLPGHGLRWFSEGFAPMRKYIIKEVIFAPVFFGCLLLSPLTWRTAGLSRDTKIALASFCAPLLVMAVYRNTFPYFFVYILAPAAVAIAPALGGLRDRIGALALALALTAIPVGLAATEPRDDLDRQRVVIDYVHREFPAGTAYLEYAGLIADYPRVIDHLTSGIGIATYHRRGEPVIGKRIDAGEVPFIIANHTNIAAALEGRPLPQTFLPQDVAAMAGQYAPLQDPLWLEGVRLPAQGDFAVRRGGSFTLSGESATIDGRRVARGETIRLAAGPHSVRDVVGANATLWRGERLPAPLPQPLSRRLFSAF